MRDTEIATERKKDRTVKIISSSSLFSERMTSPKVTIPVSFNYTVEPWSESDPFTD